jgi:hypothetical protein
MKLFFMTGFKMAFSEVSILHESLKPILLLRPELPGPLKPLRKRKIPVGLIGRVGILGYIGS